MNDLHGDIMPLAWLGWAMAAAFALLFHRLWKSARATNLRKLEVQLKEARSIIADLRTVNARLKSQNSRLRSAMHEMNVRMEEQVKRFDALMQDSEEMKQGVRDITAKLAHERELREEQYAGLRKILDGPATL